MLESPGYSIDFYTGYETAFIESIKQLGSKLWKNSTRKTSRPKVNLLGLSIWNRYLDGDLKELKRLFDLCQIDVNCCLFANNSLEEFTNFLDADLNVVLYPEMAKNAVRLIDMPYYICENLPIGFDATEKIFTDICNLLHTDVSPLLEESARARALSWFHLDNIHQISGRPNGASFAVEGSPSQITSYSKFFSEYLGMIEDTADILETNAELVFADANTIAILKTRHAPFCGIEINNPSMGYIDLLPKTQMGVTGSLFLIEQVLNGLMSRI
ncbi:nitrogenase-related protein [Lachnospiraceae bacterium TWA4]|nr:nitrogenase-related protein [Lachnospiraceae bacterium TWA4]